VVVCIVDDVMLVDVEVHDVTITLVMVGQSVVVG